MNYMHLRLLISSQQCIGIKFLKHWALQGHVLKFELESSR